MFETEQNLTCSISIIGSLALIRRWQFAVAEQGLGERYMSF
jgi:hypothetical protein